MQRSGAMRTKASNVTSAKPTDRPDESSVSSQRFDTSWYELPESEA